MWLNHLLEKGRHGIQNIFSQPTVFFVLEAFHTVHSKIRRSYSLSTGCPFFMGCWLLRTQFSKCITVYLMPHCISSKNCLTIPASWKESAEVRDSSRLAVLYCFVNFWSSKTDVESIFIGSASTIAMPSSLYCTALYKYFSISILLLYSCFACLAFGQNRSTEDWKTSTADVFSHWSSQPKPFCFLFCSRTPPFVGIISTYVSALLGSPSSSS